MTSEKLVRAVSLIRSGNKQAALPILKEIIQAEPNNEQAWLWLFSCIERIEQKKYCLQQALKINPNNQDARKALEKIIEKELTSSPSQSPRPQVQARQVAPSRKTQQSQSSVSASVLPHKQSKLKNRKSAFIAGIVIILVLCLGTIVIGGKWVFNKLIASPNSDPASSFFPSNPDYSEIGVFLLDDNDNLVNMERSRGKPSASGTPQTYASHPSFILNDPEIDPTNLIFSQYLDGRLQNEISLNLYEEGGAYRADIDTSLEDGIYCFAQYGVSVAPGQAHIWCIRIGDVMVELPPTPTPTPLPPPDIRFKAYALTVEPAKLSAEDGWNTVTATIAIENYSDKVLFVLPSEVKIRTTQGYEFDCPILVFEYYKFVPSNFRVLYSRSCHVPASNSGYTLVLNNQVVDAPHGRDRKLREPNYSHKDTEWEIVAEVNMEQINPSMTFPFIEPFNSDNYSRQDTILSHSNQSIDVLETTLNFIPTLEALWDFEILNKFNGGNLDLFMEGAFFTPDGQYSDCTINQDIGPGQAEKVHLSPCSYDIAHTLLTPSGSCWYFYEIHTTTNQKKNFMDNNLLVCYR